MNRPGLPKTCSLSSLVKCINIDELSCKRCCDSIIFGFPHCMRIDFGLCNSVTLFLISGTVNGVASVWGTWTWRSFKDESFPKSDRSKQKRKNGNLELVKVAFDNFFGNHVPISARDYWILIAELIFFVTADYGFVSLAHFLVILRVKNIGTLQTNSTLQEIELLTPN